MHITYTPIVYITVRLWSKYLAINCWLWIHAAYPGGASVNAPAAVTSSQTTTSTSSARAWFHISRPEVLLAVTSPVAVWRPVARRRRDDGRLAGPVARGVRRWGRRWCRRPLRDDVVPRAGAACLLVRRRLHFPTSNSVTPSHHRRIHCAIDLQNHIRIFWYDLGSTLLHIVSRIVMFVIQ